MIDRSPADLHDGKTLRETLSECDAGKVKGRRTSGKVALMKSTERRNEYYYASREDRHSLPAS